jgi:hypothetical protein
MYDRCDEQCESPIREADAHGFADIAKRVSVGKNKNCLIKRVENAALAFEEQPADQTRTSGDAGPFCVRTWRGHVWRLAPVGSGVLL